MSREEFRVLAILRMGAANAVHHLLPLVAVADAIRLTVARPDALPAALAEHDRVDAIDGSAKTRLGSVARTAWLAWRAALRRRPALVVSFNAVPYGVFAALLALAIRVPFHVGFVGSDLVLYGRNRLLRLLLDRAAFLTVPGAAGESILRSTGYRTRIVHLPHGIDTRRFSLPEPEESRDIDCLFVGSLLPVKQVDIVLRALRGLADRGREVRAVVLGDGPLRAELEALAGSLDLGEIVSFEGYRTDTERYFRRARVVVLPSRHEGLPFALVEGMCCGAVPVASAVGEIPRLVEHDANGLLLDDASPATLCDTLDALFADPERERRLRTGALDARRHWGYERTVDTWRQQIARLRESEPEP